MERRYGYGVTLVIIGGFFLSTSGILLRNIEAASGWQILFYRGFTFSLTLFLLLLLRYRMNIGTAFRAIGRPGLWAALVLGLGSICYIFAILWTTVANAVFIIGAAPLATAFVAWLVLGEKTSRFGVLAMLVSLAGIGLMFADGLLEGRWLGNIAALGVVASFVVFLLIIRDKRGVDMLPATCLSGLVMGGVAAFFVESFSVSNHDLAIAITMGCLQFGIGFWCFTVAARYIMASEVALFSLTESILGPIWVWIGVGEQPSLLTLAGSAVVLASVSAYCINGIRAERRLLADYRRLKAG
ncbi:MAG: DMT family transporter [Gammaproteobacteria bacterium]|nr:MAG: DMT family transporter [Gammaproteobacteria bacterium]UCH39172.1 MAG: DMT family transporter [Gammaproteobacteria bacterium]